MHQAGSYTPMVIIFDLKLVVIPQWLKVIPWWLVVLPHVAARKIQRTKSIIINKGFSTQVNICM